MLFYLVVVILSYIIILDYLFRLDLLYCVSVRGGGTPARRYTGGPLRVGVFRVVGLNFPESSSIFWNIRVLRRLPSNLPFRQAIRTRITSLE